jgi:hypothetical protein
MTNRQARMLIIGLSLLLALLLPMAVLASPSNQPQIPHPLPGHEECLSCHATGTNGAPAVPADHAGRTDATCLGCHTLAASAQSTATQTETPAQTETATPQASAEATESATAPTAEASETAVSTASGTATAGTRIPTTGGPVQILAFAFVALAIVLSGFGAKLLRQ